MELFQNHPELPKKLYLHVVTSPEGCWYNANEIINAIGLPKSAALKLPKHLCKAGVSAEKRKVLMVNDLGALCLLARCYADNVLTIRERIPVMPMGVEGQEVNFQNVHLPSYRAAQGFASALSLVRHIVDAKEREMDAKIKAARVAHAASQSGPVVAPAEPHEAPSVP